MWLMAKWDSKVLSSEIVHWHWFQKAFGLMFYILGPWYLTFPWNKIPIYEPNSYLDLRPQIISRNKCLLQLDCCKYFSRYFNLHYSYVTWFPFRYWPLNVRKTFHIYRWRSSLRSTEIKHFINSESRSSTDSLLVCRCN